MRHPGPGVVRGVAEAERVPDEVDQGAPRAEHHQQRSDDRATTARHVQAAGPGLGSSRHGRGSLFPAEMTFSDADVPPLSSNTRVISHRVVRVAAVVAVMAASFTVVGSPRLGAAASPAISPIDPRLRRPPSSCSICCTRERARPRAGCCSGRRSRPSPRARPKGGTATLRGCTSASSAPRSSWAARSTRCATTPTTPPSPG